MELTLNELKILRNALNAKLRTVHLKSSEFDDIKQTLYKINFEIERIEYDTKQKACDEAFRTINEIENAMIRWQLARSNDDETLEEINKILVSIGRLGWFNQNKKHNKKMDEILDEISQAAFSRFNDWFDSNSESFGELNGERLFSETETKRLCLKLSKELIESVRDNDFHFKNMSTIEVLEYLLK